MEIEFTLRKTDREPTTIRNKPSKPEIPGSNPGRRMSLLNTQINSTKRPPHFTVLREMNYWGNEKPLSTVMRSLEYH